MHNPNDLINSLKDNVMKLLRTPDGLKQLGIPDTVRVSPQIYNETRNHPSTFPVGIQMVLDEDLTGEQWELGPKQPSEAQPSAGDAVESATSESVIVL